MLNIVLFGPPGAGKGTQSMILLEKLKLTHLSTGDLLRAERDAQTPLGLEAQKLMNEGLLVPDEIVIKMIENKIVATPKTGGFIFDGFPRTIPQAEALDRLLESMGQKIDVMLLLEVNKDELTARLLKRAYLEGRTDDTEEVINKRFDVYQTTTKPVAEYYKAQGKLRAVWGEGSLNDVTHRILLALNIHS